MYVTNFIDFRVNGCAGGAVPAQGTGKGQADAEAEEAVLNVEHDLTNSNRELGARVV
jgi:hypothetical protein